MGWVCLPVGLGALERTHARAMPGVHPMRKTRATPSGLPSGPVLVKTTVLPTLAWRPLDLQDHNPA